MLQVSGSPEVFLHNESGIDKGDEGFVQTFPIETVSLGPYEHIYVSVWAVNKVCVTKLYTLVHRYQYISYYI